MESTQPEYVQAEALEDVPNLKKRKRGWGSERMSGEQAVEGSQDHFDHAHEGSRGPVCTSFTKKRYQTSVNVSKAKTTPKEGIDLTTSNEQCA
jgi:hypothetical protein